jgi:dipeptidyl aminopeptidase/acylaminoacyl peptidase
MKKKIFCSAFFLCFLFLHAQNKRKLIPSDVYNFKSVSNPHVSPDGQWILYSLATPDSTKNKQHSDLFMSSWDGNESLQITFTPEGESNAKFSPDGKYISYLSSKKVDSVDTSQLWLMDRRGGEAKQITKVTQELEDYEWSQDGSNIVLVMKDAEDKKKKKDDVKDPIVVDRYHFKQDVKGYVLNKNTHLYLLNLASKNVEQLTTGDYDEKSPAWSPDGKNIVFVSNRTENPDRNDDSGIYLIEAKKESQVKQLTSWKGEEGSPQYSKDGKFIAYLRSTGSDTFVNYDNSILTIMDPDGSNEKLLTQQLDRPVGNFRWSPDSKSIAFLVQDDRLSYISEVDIRSGKVAKVIEGERSFSELESRKGSEWLTMMSDPQHPENIYTLTDGKLNQITHVNEDWLKNVELADVKGFESTSKDGTKVSGLFYKPAGTGDQKLPFILFIHGGPVAQDDYGFDFTRQILAGGGYAVAAVNYRGSNGRGIDFSKAIYADWGNLEVQDLLGAVDYLVDQQWIDKDRLGIGGWSYGGILTDYTIATDTRFKAACSGAGSAMQLSMYGIDQYLLQWNEEIGLPWTKEGLDLYLKLSYPFTHANKIKTPTLFMVGQNDFNVPSEGSEQMYAALQTLNIPTKLVIYPDQFHGIRVLSYQVDRYQRYLDWYGKYLQK